MAVPLIIDEQVNIRLAELRMYAEANPISYTQLEKMVREQREMVGDDPRHVIYIPVGFKAVFSIEGHPLKDKSGVQWIKHFSMSASGKDRVPHVVSVELIIKELGMKPLKQCYVYQENMPNGNIAINVMSPMHEEKMTL